MGSTTIIVPDRGTYAVISDIIEELTLEDLARDFGRFAWASRPATPRRITYALLSLEHLLVLTGREPHPLHDVQTAFSMLVPVDHR